MLQGGDPRRNASSAEQRRGQKVQSDIKSNVVESASSWMNLKPKSHLNKRPWQIAHSAAIIIEAKPNKEVNTISEAVRYISGTGQYWCTVLGLLLFYIFNIHIYTHTNIDSNYYMEREILNIGQQTYILIKTKVANNSYKKI